ncbi:Hypothetical predicted protein [Lecanosticta acicola]|uniref:Uncharacterized protein n=1 Tax=Lecanosticta acicola TaxID=111012 RepID=A0AAI8YWW8_9PEZI|nr:Hypothetical predicted protein [Lecanosticta acicola]
MALRAPWNKGWVRIAMPVALLLVLLNTFAVLALAIFNVAALDLSDHDKPDSIQASTFAVRVQLVFFWCTIPLVLFITTVCEKFCLWADRLSPIRIVTSSALAIAAWIVQIALWDQCISSVGSANTPGYCPYVYQGDGWGTYPSWEVASPHGAVDAIPTLFILYLFPLCFASIVMNRQRRTSFRKSDMRQSWVRQMEEAASESALISPEQQGRFTSPVLRPSEFEATLPPRPRKDTISGEIALSPFDNAGQARGTPFWSDNLALSPLDIPTRSRSSSTASNINSDDRGGPVTSLSAGNRSRSSTYSQPDQPSLSPTESSNPRASHKHRSRASTVSSSRGRYYSGVSATDIPLPDEPLRTYPADESKSTERRASRSQSNLNLAYVKSLPEILPPLPLKGRNSK